MSTENADDFEDESAEDSEDGTAEDSEEETADDFDDELEEQEPEDDPTPGRAQLLASRLAARPPFRPALRLARRLRALIPDWLTKALLLRMAGVAVCTLGVALSTFVAEVAVLGRFEHRHDQQIEYAAFRAELAAGTAPIGARDYRGVPLQPGAPVALLSIPSIGVDEVVAEGTTAAVLESGPGLASDTVLPGQSGTSEIMARAAAYGGPFRYLDQLQPGDRVEVTTGQGVAEYRVSDVRHSGDPEPARLRGQLGRLTLVTATGIAYAPDDALHVDADLISDVQPTPPGRTPHPGSEQTAMGEDRYARWDVLGWAAVLGAATVLAFWAGPRWGRSKTWLVAAPVLLVVGLTLADRIALLLPNLT